MFTERFNTLLTLLGASASDLAKLAQCDRSYVSRLMHGSRVPKRGGRGARRLVNGLYLRADEIGALDALCEAVGCERRDSADAIRDRVTDWLFEGEAEDGRTADASADKVPFRAFGEKLSAVMELTELSNIRLGRSLNIDPSYISRFRNGFRAPRSNPKLMSDICLTLLDRVEAQDKSRALAALLDVSESETDDRDGAFDALYRWLYSTDDRDSAPVVEELIDEIGAFSADLRRPPMTFEQAADPATLADDAQTYYGVDGLRRAVIRFLANVIRKGGRELFLYSDQNIGWMVSDPVFRARWATLMVLCVGSGTRINIIHNVNRDLGEMADAIRSWLPLYPSGMIRSYYCKTSNRPRFSTTLFLCPGYACISGSNVVGTEDASGMYRYDVDPAQLEAHRAAYRELLDHSGELAHVYRHPDELRPADADLASPAVLGSTLSLATMPEKVLASALARSGADEETKRGLEELRRDRAALLKRVLRKGFVDEYTPLATTEELAAGQVAMDVPGLSLTYTPREYAGHVAGLAALADANPNFRLYVLPEAPFEDVRVLVTENAVSVTRLKAPFLTIHFEHPDLCRAFVAYASRIRERYRSDRLTTKKLLERMM